MLISLKKPKRMNENILIIERRLFSAIGHERTQVNAINELIGNEKSIVISCKGINLNNMPFKNKVISKLPKFNLKEEGKEPLKYIQESGDSLIKIIEENKFKKNTKIIIPSARKLEIALIIYLYKQNKIPLTLNIVIRILDLVFIKDLTKSQLNIFIELINKGLIKLFTETEELIKKIENNFKIKCSGVLILPVSVPYNLKINNRKIRKKDHLYIGCLGGPRRSKGTFIIPKIIKNLRKYFKKNKINFKVTFIIQMSKDKNKRRILFKIAEFLSRHISSSVKVKYVYGVEDNKKFILLLKSINIFLLPYSNIHYKYSGSGFITDAIFLEKPIINSEGMAMNDLRRFENSISVSNINDYSSAIIKISKNYEYYVSNSKFAKKYLKNKIRKSFDAILR